MARKPIKAIQASDPDGPAPGANGSGVTFSGLDPLLGSVGGMIGLLTQTDADTKTYALDENWFTDPINKTRDGIKKSPEQFGALLAQLLGEIGGNAMGIPVKDPALLGTWYPIQYKNSEGKSVASGLYIVSYTDANTKATVIGLGVLKRWGIMPDDPKINVDVWGLIPFALFNNGDFGLAFTEAGYPISVGVAVEGSDADNPLINENGIVFNGVKFSAGVDLFELKFDVSLEVLDLQLAGDPAPRNYSLADLEAIQPQQILNTAANLFIGALSKQFPAHAESIQYMAPLFGLSDQIPSKDFADTRLPILAWYDLFKIVFSGTGSPVTPFLNWFNSITSSPDLFKGWISCLGGFLGIATDKLNVAGDGSRNNPYRVPILEVGSIGQLNFSAASVVVDKGDRFFYPGLSFSSTGIDLGTSPAQFLMAAELELGKFQLSGSSVSAAFDVNFKVNFALQNKKPGELLISVGKDKVGSMAAGLSLGVLSGTVVPYVELLNVSTADSQYASVNLLSPGQLATVGAAVLSDQLQNLIGVNEPDASDFVKGVAALVGLIPPDGVGADWPVPPFSAKGMESSISQPLEAWANYYYQILNPAGHPATLPFTYILQSFAALLKIGDVAVTVNGKGKKNAPWMVGISLKDKSLPAYLTAYEENLTASGGVALTFGFELAPVITIGTVEIAPSLFLKAVTVNLPDDSTQSAVASWFPEVGAQVALPNGFQTPTVGGAYLKVTQAQLSAGWGQAGGWNWSMQVNAPSLFADGKALPPLPDLNFGLQTDWNSLVTQLAATFGPFFAAAAGIALMRTNTRSALLAGGSLGLLTDFSQYDIFKNSGLSWSGFTPIPLSRFDQPFQTLRTQLANNLSSADKAKSQLALLAWTLSSAAKAPAISGKGTFAEPFMMPLPLGFEMPLWYDPVSGILGLGVGYSDHYSYPAQSPVLAVEVVSRLNALEYNLKNGSVVASGNAPSLSLEAIVSKPGGLLIDLPKDSGTVEKIILGFQLGLNNGQLSFSPIVTLVQAKLPGQSSAADITLSDFLDPAFGIKLQSAFQSLLNTGIQLAIDQVKDKALFQKAYSLLSLMGLALDPCNGAYGINTGGWSGLLANPQGYVEKQLLGLVEIPAKRNALFAFLAQIFHLNLPPLPDAALDLLRGLKICGPAEQGYPISAKALLDIASDPINSLENRFKALFDDADTLKKLAKDLTQNLPSKPYGNFTFGATSNGVATLSVQPKNAFKIGDFVEISGSLALDFNNQKLVATLDSYVPAIGLTLSDGLSLTYSAGTVAPGFSASLIWGDGSTPNAMPLQLLPFDSGKFLDQVAHLAPAYTLNVFLTAVFEDQLLTKYPVVQSVFDVLGIGKNDNGVWTMPSLLGIMTHPLDWLLSDDVLGLNGKFDVAKLAEKLAKFPSKSASNGLTIGPNSGKNGIAITGLPYDFEVDFSGDAATNTASFGFGVKEIEIAGGKGALDNLSFAVHLTSDYQASFSGGLDLATLATTLVTPFFVSVGFDKSFALKITQGTPKAPLLGVQFLPFLGWGKLAEDAGVFAAVQVIDTMVPKIIAELKANGAEKFAQALTDFGNNIPVGDLVTTLVPIATSGDPASTIVKNLEAASLTWLKGLFGEGSGQLGKTVAEIQALFAVPGITITVNKDANGLLQYTPSENLPLTIYFGLDENKNLGLWAGLQIPHLKYLNIDVTRTGIGVDLATLSQLDFSFGFNVIVPLDGQNGPGLYLKYDPKTFFNLGFDPVANNADPDTQSTLARELVPEFFPPPAGDTHPLGERVTDWLLQVIKNVLPRYVSVLILNQESVVKWLTYHILDPVGKTGPTPVDVLSATTLIKVETQSSDTPEAEGTVIYSLNSIDEIVKITPLAFLGKLVKALLQEEITVVKFGTGDKSVIVLGPDPNDENSYGLRLTAPDLAIGALPNLLLQLGATDDEWIKQSWSLSKDSKLLPGVQFYVPIKTEPSVEVDFDNFNIILENVGFDIQGKNGKPIVDLTRFKLGAVKPRILLDLKFNGASAPTVTFGGNVTLADIGISLAPNQLLSGSNSNSQNPIASSLMGSGSDAKGASTNNPPANPTFSVQAAYTDQLWVNLKSDTGDGEEVIIPVQRAFGPLFVESLGLGWEQEPKRLDFIFTGNVSLAGLEVSLVKLEVGIPVTTPAEFDKYTLDLAGLDVSYKGGSVVISGGFLKQEDPLQYIGQAVIKAGSFSILAVGAYARVPVDKDTSVTSLFIFGALKAPLGGVPAFFITGVAAGFGYNRSIKIPSVEGIIGFPLVSGVVNGSLTQSNDQDNALKALADVVAPSVGEYWLAAGLTFSSFEIINTAALIFISFGKEFELNILGLSWASLPPQLSKDSALAYFELAIKVSFKPAEGIISVEAQLTPNSFVLTRDCKVTGGFAFYLWYKTITQTFDKKPVTIPAGQFVVTLGGYHPQFLAPVYYPSVPRLGLQWILEVGPGKLSISGGTYFAICPTAVMAGGYLKVLFELGPIKAWLDAYANFLIEWHPFYFNVGIGITVGVSFGFTIGSVSITLKFEIGAKLQLQGPPVNGFIEVELYIVSFTIPFGNQQTETKDNFLKAWDDFAATFLPPPKPIKTIQTELAAVALADKIDDGQQIIKWNVGSGMLNGKNTSPGDDQPWVVQSMYYSFGLSSVIPSSEVSIAQTAYKQSGPAVGIRPMGFSVDLNAPLLITLSDSQGPVDIVLRGISISQDLNGAPAALWSKKELSRDQAPSGESMIIASALMGVVITADQYVHVVSIPAFDINELAFTPGDDRLLPFFYNTCKNPIGKTGKCFSYPAAQALAQTTPYTTIMKTIMAADVVSTRNDIYAALESVHIEAPANPDLSVMATSADLVLQAFPVLAAIGCFQTGTPQGPVAIPAGVKIERQAPAPKAFAAPSLQGVLRRYRSRNLVSGADKGLLPVQRNQILAKWTSFTGLSPDTKRQPSSLLEGSAFSKMIHPGGAIVLQLDPNAGHILNLEGRLTLMMAGFDEYHNLLEIKTINDVKNYPLPRGTAQIVLFTYDGSEHDTIGWQRDTLLTKVNSQWAVGDGCLLHVQNSQRIAVNTRKDAHGLVEASRLLDGNKVLSSADTLSTGWIQTILHSAKPYIAVLVDGPTADAVAVTISLNRLPMHLGQSTPVQTIAYGKKTLLIFETPGKSDEDSFLGLMAYSRQESQKVEGVYSLDKIEKAFPDVWSSLSLQYNAMDMEEAITESSKLTVVMDEE